MKDQTLPGDRALVALGANLGDPLSTLARALGELARLPGVRLKSCSHAYRTEPFDAPSPQPDYWNAVCELQLAWTPEQLLEELHRLEQIFGRDRDAEGYHGARRLDLDLLLHGDRCSLDRRLRLPHPGLEDRIFVLAPLADLRPNLRLAGGRTVLERAAEVRAAGQVVLEVAELEPAPLSAAETIPIR